MSGQPDERSAPVRIGLIAGGPDGVTLLNLLLGWPSATVVAVVDPLPGALALQQARSRGIPAATRPLEVLGHLPVDLVIESTGQPAILDEFLRARPPGLEVIHAKSLPFLRAPPARPDREPRAAGSDGRDPAHHQQLPHRRGAGAGRRRPARRAPLRRAGRGSLPGGGRGPSRGGEDRTASFLADRRGRTHQPRLGDRTGRGRPEARPRAGSPGLRCRVPGGGGLREAVRPPDRARHSPPARRSPDRSDPGPRHGAPTVHRHADPASRDLRGPGRHRHREHPSLQGARSPEPRPHADDRAADGDRRDPPRHLHLAHGRSAGVRHHRAQRRRLCQAAFGFVFRFDGTLMHVVAHHNLPAEARRRPRAPMAHASGSAQRPRPRHSGPSRGAHRRRAGRARPPLSRHVTGSRHPDHAHGSHDP